MNSKFIAIFLKHLEKNKVKIMYEQLGPHSLQYNTKEQYMKKNMSMLNKI